MVRAQLAERNRANTVDREQLGVSHFASVLEVLMIRLWPFLLEREISCLRRDSRAALRNVCVNVL